MERNDACWCGSGKKYKKCHMFIDEKIALLEEQGHGKSCLMIGSVRSAAQVRMYSD